MYTKSCYVVNDETFCCSSGCPHPTCWESQRRLIRGVKQPPVNEAAAKLPRLHYDFPTQKIQNVVTNVFDSGQVVHESAASPTRLHRGVSLIEYLQTKARNSRRSAHLVTPQTSPDLMEMAYSMTPTCNAIPAPYPHKQSLLSASGRPSTHLGPLPHAAATPSRPEAVSTVEVQEVFEPFELDTDWQDTFAPRPYYLWVPRRDTEHAGPAAGGGFPEAGYRRARRRGDSVPALQLAPAEGEATGERETTIVTPPTSLKGASESLSPIQPKTSTRAPRYYGRSRASRRQHQPNQNVPLSLCLQDSVANLMGLPANVLSDVLNSIESGAPLTREEFTKLLQTSSDNGGVAAENVKPHQQPAALMQDILQQRKACLHAATSRISARPQPESVDTKQSKYHLDLTTPTSVPVLRLPPLPPVSSPVPAVRSYAHLPCIGLTEDVPLTASFQHDLVQQQQQALANLSSLTASMTSGLMLGPVDKSQQQFYPNSGSTTSRTENDSASLRVTASTGRSTLYEEILPGYTTNRPSHGQPSTPRGVLSAPLVSGVECISGPTPPLPDQEVTVTSLRTETDVLSTVIRRGTQSASQLNIKGSGGSAGRSTVGDSGLSSLNRRRSMEDNMGQASGVELAWPGPVYTLLLSPVPVSGGRESHLVVTIPSAADLVSGEGQGQPANQPVLSLPGATAPDCWIPVPPPSPTEMKQEEEPVYGDRKVTTATTPEPESAADHC